MSSKAMESNFQGMDKIPVNVEPKNTPNIAQDKNLYIIIGVTLISIMGAQTVAPILPSLRGVFNVSEREIELVMTLFVLPIGIATPILGVGTI